MKLSKRLSKEDRIEIIREAKKYLLKIEERNEGVEKHHKTPYSVCVAIDSRLHLLHDISIPYRFQKFYFNAYDLPPKKYDLSNNKVQGEDEGALYSWKHENLKSRLKWLDKLEANQKD